MASKLYTVYITSASSKGPYTLYYDAIDSTKIAVVKSTGAYATSVSYTDLVAGVEVAVPDTAESIIVYNQACLTSITKYVGADPITAILTLDYCTVSAYSNYFSATLSARIPSTDILISSVVIEGHTSAKCSDTYAVSDSPSPSGQLSIVAGATSVGIFPGVIGNTPFLTSTYPAIRFQPVYVNGSGPYVNNDTVLVGGTTVTINLAPYGNECYLIATCPA